MIRLPFITVGAGCGFLLAQGLYNAMANDTTLQNGGERYGQFSMLQGIIGMVTGVLYAAWNLGCPHCLSLRQEQIGVTVLISVNLITAMVLAACWYVGAPEYPVFVGASIPAYLVGNCTNYLLFPMIATYYSGWLTATVRAGTDVTSLITSLLGQLEDQDPTTGQLRFPISVLFLVYTLFSLCSLASWSSIMHFGTGLRDAGEKISETASDCESDSESSETSDSIGASSVSGCLEGVAVPRQMVVPLILATMAEVAQYGVASSLGEIGAQMTDPDSCTGAAGKEVYRVAYTCSMLAVPLGSIASSLAACPRWLFNIFSAVQCTSAILVGICALGLIPAMAPFWQSKGGQALYIVCFTLVAGFEGYLFTMAFRYIGDAEDISTALRQSSSRLLSLLGVIAVNPISFALGYQINNGNIHCTPARHFA